MNKLIVLLVILCSGCSWYNDVNVHKEIDQNEKSITFPVGGTGLIGALKQELYNQNWNIKMDSQSSEEFFGSEGSVYGSRKTDNQNKRTSYKTYKTRYRILVSASQVDICIFSGSPTLSYNISIIDNNTDDEAITMHGLDCEYNVIGEFRKALRY